VLLQYNRDLIYYTNNNITKLPLVLCWIHEQYEQSLIV
jgi:hypothetical protein